MKYRFAFDRTQLIILLGGIVLAGLLTYVTGVFTGLALSAPSKGEIATLKAHEAQLKQAVAAALPPQLAQTQPTAAAPPAPASTAPGIVQDYPPPAAKPAPPAAKAAPSAAEALGVESAPDKDVYSLQVGSFADAKLALQLQTDLRERGYPASIYTGVDTDHKEWHEVRIGGFSTLSKASAAASAFTNKERLQAMIRRSGTL